MQVQTHLEVQQKIIPEWKERRGDDSTPLLHNYISCISVGSRLKLSQFSRTFIGKKPILKIYSNFTIEWDSSKEAED